jgi:hypothetical protein
VFFTLEDGTQIVYFYSEQSIVATESSASGHQSFFDFVTSNTKNMASDSSNSNNSTPLGGHQSSFDFVTSKPGNTASSGGGDNNHLNPPVIQGEVGRKIHSTDQIIIKAEAGSMVTITFSVSCKRIKKTIEFTSNDTEKNAPVLTNDHLHLIL